VETFVGRKSKTNLCRPEYFVRSEGGVAVRGKVWKEILVALEKVKPDVRSTISFQNSA
jgi:hypothetical protein